MSLRTRLDRLAGDYHRWLYRGGRLSTFGKWRYLWQVRALSRTGLVPRLVTLEVPGRTSGKAIGYPLVLAEIDGARYLVSMLGHHSGWVRNARANGLRATLRTRTATPVRLVELPPDPDVAAPLLKAYLRQAPGARPHVAVDHRAPVADFRSVVADHPIFRVEPDAGERWLGPRA